VSEQTPGEGESQQPQQPQQPAQGQGSAGAMDMGATWLRGDGESHDVVMSSRVRLARNLAGRPFATKASRRDRVETMQVCRDCVMNAGLAEKIIWVDIHGSPALERQLLVERHLISKNHGKGRGANPNEDPRGVAISVPDERLAIMVNEEDHLRLQAIRSGLALSDAWSDVDSADDKIESRLTYAFSSKFGYLTACPTNVGTGLRMSVMLHLPGLRLTGEIEKVKRAATDMALAVRGFYGEGSEPVGDLFQISNQATLGKSEAQVLHELERQIVPRVVEYERLSRRELLAKRRVGLEDQVWRSWGMLSSARLLTTEEAMGALSLLRLGASMGLLRGAGPGGEGPTMRVVNQLMLLVQPAHLQRAVGRELDQEQRRAARATLVRTKLTRPRVA
jgi:protein arginine kinase